MQYKKDVKLAEQQPYKAIINKDLTYLKVLVDEQQPDAIMALEQALALGNLAWYYP